MDLITAPCGVEKALEKKPVKLPVTGNSKLTAPQRLDIYANMYFYRIRDSLKEDFGHLLKVVGEIGFHNLITDYLLKYPSRYFSLRDVGRDLPKFLSKKNKFSPPPSPLPRGEGAGGRVTWNYLADLAQFEWALIESFDSADSLPLTESQLKSVPAEKWASLHFHFVPSFRLLELNWKVDDLKPKKQKTKMSVWRKKFKVFYKAVDLLEAKLIKEILKNKNFGKLCQLTAKTVGPAKASQTMAGYLMMWIKDEMLEDWSLLKN